MPGNGFHLCETCKGHGFSRVGVMPEVRYPVCPTCAGFGQRYIEVDGKPPPPVEKPRPAHDPVRF